jgi:hypothetical protein
MTTSTRCEIRTHDLLRMRLDLSVVTFGARRMLTLQGRVVTIYTIGVYNQ